MRKQQRLLLLAGLLTPLLAQAAAVLTLLPATGSIQAMRGSVVGWGFTISNPDANFLAVTSAAFCKTTVVAGFTVCDQFPDPALGTFTDYIAHFNFIPFAKVHFGNLSCDLRTNRDRGIRFNIANVPQLHGDIVCFAFGDERGNRGR